MNLYSTIYLKIDKLILIKIKNCSNHMQLSVGLCYHACHIHACLCTLSNKLNIRIGRPKERKEKDDSTRMMQVKLSKTLFYYRLDDAKDWRNYWLHQFTTWFQKVKFKSIPNLLQKERNPMFFVRY